MDNQFYFFILIVIQLVFIYFNSVITFSYFNLYKRKKNPDWPLFTEEAPEYINKGEIHKIFLSFFFQIKIIFFERHKDSELKAAANKTRLLHFAYVGFLILGFFLYLFLN